MLLSLNESHALWRVAKKEWAGFFLSPIAYLFLAVFCCVTLFVFYWAEAFYARNIADVAPLFRWLPILFIFLCSALTMRSWSEERRSGTLEHVLTQPVSLASFVVGKFFGALAVLTIALLMTLPIPISVALLAPLDWGPVVAGYLAALLLGAAYIAIGQFASSRTDNQIVALILSVAICSLFYFIGSQQLLSFFGLKTQAFLGGLSTQVRFADITRGVIDLRDFYYFFSLIAVFLVVTIFALERERWNSLAEQKHHTHWRWASLLLVANLLTANLWLNYFAGARIDTTAGKQYSLSDTTEQYLSNLNEPLLIRGYFSEKTHPLLAPLIPQLTNLLAEYDVVSNKVTVEIIDPKTDPEVEQEARERYGIEAVPLQLADRYQASIVASYFNVLVQYADEYEVLSFEDMIDIRSAADGQTQVALRNPEFDITKSIKTVIQRFQSAGNIFSTLTSPLTFTAFVSEQERLPEELISFQQQITEVLAEQQQLAGDLLNIEWVNVEQQGIEFAEQLAANYGFRPLTTSLLDSQSFYFYMLLADENQEVQIPLNDLTAEDFERNLSAALQRFSTGFRRTLALVTPQGNGFGPSASPQFNQLRSWLASEWQVIDEDLSDGRVSGQVDALWLLAPEQLSEQALFAIDQFLMQGGNVFIATAPYQASLQNGDLTAQPYESGLTNWLAHHGVELDDALVMDAQSSLYPVPVTRNIGGLTVQDIGLLPYPYFLDVRDAGINAEHPMMAGLSQINVSWPSPLRTNDQLAPQVEVTDLLTSSKRAQLSDSLLITPTNEAGFTNLKATGEAFVIAKALQGQFTSYFNAETIPAQSGLEEGDFELTQVIEKSPASAKLVVFASNSFLSDQVLQLSNYVNPSLPANNLAFASNAVDWSLEDASLMSIRARGVYSQLLPPMTPTEQKLWEYGNYFVVILLIALIGFISLRKRALRQRKQTQWLMGEGELA